MIRTKLWQFCTICNAYCNKFCNQKEFKVEMCIRFYNWVFIVVPLHYLSLKIFYFDVHVNKINKLIFCYIHCVLSKLISLFSILMRSSILLNADSTVVRSRGCWYGNPAKFKHNDKIIIKDLCRYTLILNLTQHSSNRAWLLQL